MVKDFGFGFGLHDARSRAKVQDAARRAEELGFDAPHAEVFAKVIAELR